MTDLATWARRVRQWRASGLTSEEFCAGKTFTAGGLRNAASRIERGAAVPLARVERSGVEATSVAGGPVADPRAGLVIEVGRARVTVAPGSDRATLATVLELLTVGGGQ